MNAELVRSSKANRMARYDALPTSASVKEVRLSAKRDSGLRERRDGANPNYSGRSIITSFQTLIFPSGGVLSVIDSITMSAPMPE